MPHPPSRAEILLLAGSAALFAIAVGAPPLLQSAHYHQFADGRVWLGLPNAANLLSNLPFLCFGLWGAARLAQARHALGRVELAGATVFFAGLVLTAIGSSLYHWQPADATLALDRAAMAVAFAGLLSLAAAERVSSRAGALLGLSLLVAGPATVWLWSVGGNLLPWALVQGGGMAFLLVLAGRRAGPGTLSIRWGWVIGIYVLAKALEWADQSVFDLTGAMLSGHSAKHLVAALSALPVIFAMGLRSRATHNPEASVGASIQRTYSA
ncbi:MAG: hypothetical protein ABI589_12840 [Burkholderiales bacterium]